ncbi:DUF2652 domain-containing protein [Flavicella sediminum]|uniref:DUF2652 domain-containing protein n=1 Tax=Flavicella sediminum TaxID=2585141 RepID=UPI001FB6B697|nr:DUF2652 domain-containing protein [Flavicella sediminum]
MNIFILQFNKEQQVNYMPKSLLFLPDISGYTEFVQTTEISHSQHVIAELLEILVSANTLDLKLAEVEGDALFFYKEEIPSLEKILAQVETMFTAFFSQLDLLKNNRICPCNACSSAVNLELKIVVHCGDIEFITVQNKKKPFGPQVIEAHRLMKNSIASDNYVLISQTLADEIFLTEHYKSKLFDFEKLSDTYDKKVLAYQYAKIATDNLKLNRQTAIKKINFKKSPSVLLEKKFPIEANQLMEYLSNYSFRHLWVEGVDAFEFNKNEVTRIGSGHVCVINQKHLNFTTVTKDVEENQLIYGEVTSSFPFVDAVYQFYTLTPISKKSCELKLEIYAEATSFLKKLVMAVVVKKILKKNAYKAIESLYEFIKTKKN